jgi:hypothetical protein
MIKPWVYAAAIILLFLGGSMLGRTTGHWQTDISTNEYLFHIRHLNLPFYQHSRGQIPDYDKEAWLRMMKKIKEAKVAAHRNVGQSDAKN